MEDVTYYLRLWFKEYGQQLDEAATQSFQKACEQVGIMAQDEVSYAVAQTENDYDGWVSPDQLAEYYKPYPLDKFGNPIHED